MIGQHIYLLYRFQLAGGCATYHYFYLQSQSAATKILIFVFIEKTLLGDGLWVSPYQNSRGRMFDHTILQFGRSCRSWMISDSMFSHNSFFVEFSANISFPPMWTTSVFGAGFLLSFLSHGLRSLLVFRSLVLYLRYIHTTVSPRTLVGSGVCTFLPRIPGCHPSPTFCDLHYIEYQ